jgi:hypothetical protein
MFVTIQRNNAGNNSSMSQKSFTVTIPDLGDASASYLVPAESESSETSQPLQYAGIPGARDIPMLVVAGFVPSEILKTPSGAFDQAEVGSDPPPGGWIINATSRDGRVLVRQYMVALNSPTEALKAATSSADEMLTITLGSRVDLCHFVRRKMNKGDVFELGIQHIRRGKNVRR